jgi:hypothetical protein
VFNNTQVAEKAAVWAFWFMFAGAIHSIIKIAVENRDEADEFSFLSFIEKNKYIILLSSFIKALLLFFVRILVFCLNLIKQAFSKVFSYFVNIFFSIFGYLINILKKIINTRPKSFKDVLASFIKIVAVFSLTCLFFFFFFSLPIIIGFTATKTAIIVKDIAIAYQKKLRDENFKKDRKLLDPVIEKIEPSIVYPATKVIVFGKGFNSRAVDKSLNKAILRSKGDKIATDYWDDNKIMFTVPLHWKSGLNHIWIDKPIIWDNKEDLAKSNVVSLKLIPVSQTFTPDDYEYFKQLKTLDKETLRINGY